MNQKLLCFFLSFGLCPAMATNSSNDRSQEKALVGKRNPPEEMLEGLLPLLALPINDMPWTTRTRNALQMEGIYYIGALVQRTEINLLIGIPNFGKKSLAEVTEWLTSRGLQLGMDVNWPSDRDQEKELVNKLNPPKEIPEGLIPILTLPIDSTDWDISIKRTFKAEGVNYIGALTHWSEMRLTMFSWKTKNKIKDWLVSRGLQLGMNINWPSDLQEERELVKKLNPPKEEEWAGIFLTPREEQILKMRLGIGETPHTFKEIGEILDLSQERVRQIQATVLRKLYNAIARVNSNILYHLGVKFYEGKGVNRELQKAAEFWSVASVKGHADAQYSLGYLYLKGEGVDKDPEQATQLWRKAAEQDHKEAQKSLNEQQQCSPHLFEEYEYMNNPRL